jgi:hypothetical protein
MSNKITTAIWMLILLLAAGDIAFAISAHASGVDEELIRFLTE